MGTVLLRSWALLLVMLSAAPATADEASGPPWLGVGIDSGIPPIRADDNVKPLFVIVGIVLVATLTQAISRQLFLGDTLDTDHIDAKYDAGVLTLRIPIAERAKPRKIAITSGEDAPKQIDA